MKLLATVQITGGAPYIGNVVWCVTGQAIEAVEAPRRAGDPPVLAASSQKIRAELGWKPERPDLEAMISDAWAWMRKYPRGYGE